MYVAESVKVKGAHTHRNLARYDDERGVRGV